MMSRNVLAWAVLLWAVLSWGGRIVIVFDTGSDVQDRLRIGLAVAVALLAFGALLSGRFLRTSLVSYAAVSGVIWVRSVVTVVAEGATPGFVGVHLALAAVSLTLAAAALVIVWRLQSA